MRSFAQWLAATLGRSKGLDRFPFPTAPAPVLFHEDIRLVIWDLDETFWRGTLTEGGHAYVDAHHDLVIDLARRGIISSICSNNDHDRIRSVLQDQGLWSYFVFPSIDWTPKAPRIESMIDRIGLRPPTVLFIDDNRQNLHQAQDLAPDLNIALPDVIPCLSNHPQLQGKPDLGLTRLAQYRLLEQKNDEAEKSGGDNTAFLRASDIRVCFDYDVEEHIDRAIELINRTNQLNFTKERLPEDPAEARAQFIPLLRNWRTVAALVRVTDRYGDYGYVGVFVVQELVGDQVLKHFCFSCRTLNMHVEHFVYQSIGRPVLDVRGDVLSDVKAETPIVDWIRLLPSDRMKEGHHLEPVKPIDGIFMRGGCDLQPLMHYLRINCPDIKGEFNDIKSHQARRWDHSSFLCYALFGYTIDQMHAAWGLGYDAHDFLTTLPRGDQSAALYILSFWADADVPLYRHKATGIELPYFLFQGPDRDLVADVAFTEGCDLHPLQVERLARLRADWDHIGRLTPEAMHDRYRSILRLIPATSRVIMTLANEREPQHFGAHSEGPINEHHRGYNRVLRALGSEFHNLTIIDVASLIRDKDDMFDINHLRREVYYSLYQKILSCL